MRKFLLFLAGLAAALVILAMIGPMALLALGAWLLYLIFKQFMKSDSVGGKIGWVVLGLIVLSITFANGYAVIGLGAAIILYLVIKNWNKDDSVIDAASNDPFTNFERQWADLNK